MTDETEEVVWRASAQRMRSELADMGLEPSTINAAMTLAMTGESVDLGCGQKLRRSADGRLFEIVGKYRAICGQRAWPYTEHNICVLQPHEGSAHEDDRGRPFSHAGYDRTYD